jgi:phage baseplate assembly protein W
VLQIPKFDIPFTVSGGKAVVVEQDSDEEIVDCVYAILATERGERAEEPTFGLPDPAFREAGADLDQIRSVAEEWEPRARTLTESDFDGIVQKVRVSVG